MDELLIIQREIQELQLLVIDMIVWQLMQKAG